MTLRELGQSGLSLSSVGVGTWAMGGSGWSGERNDEGSIGVIRAAVDSGANWIDTAPVYGLGHAERVVGRALRQFTESQRPLIFTKCGFAWNEECPDRYWQLLTPDRIRQEFERCARRLGVDCIDLFQIHWPDLTTPGGEAIPLEESWGAMARLAEEGKVRAIGVSNFGVDELERCEQVRHVDSVQPPLSLIGQSAMLDVIPWARRHGTGVITYSPLQSGLLTEQASVEWAESFGDDDWRAGAPEFNSPRLERNLALRDALRPVARRHACDVAAIAVAWVIGVDGVTGAIVGGRSAEQVRGWIRAGEIKLSSEDSAEIEAGLRATGAGEDWTVYPNPRVS
jgi:aryl-alcohol dehydrogenase-like predicted oxidoreductase